VICISGFIEIGLMRVPLEVSDGIMDNLDAGYWLLVIGCGSLAAGYTMLDIRFFSSEFPIQPSEFQFLTSVFGPLTSVIHPILDLKR
jgi:hypothetical protein